MVLTGSLLCSTGCWHCCFDVLSNTLALPLFMGTTFSLKSTQSQILVIDVDVGLRAGVVVVMMVGVGGSPSYPFTDGWVTPLRKTGAEGIITRGDSLGCRLMTACMHAGRLWQLWCFVYNHEATLPDRISALSQTQNIRT